MFNTFVPSLDFMTLVKIAVTLWSQNDITYTLTTGTLFPYYGSKRVKWPDDEEISELAGKKQLKRAKWSEIEDHVLGKLSQLPLPGTLKDKISAIIKPVGLEISKWKHCHYWESRYLAKISPDELYWTVQGTVDYKKSAKVFVNNETFDITKRYRLACIYCLEDDILELWNRLPNSTKNSYYRGGIVQYSGEEEEFTNGYFNDSDSDYDSGLKYNEDTPTTIGQGELEVFWSYDLCGRLGQMRRTWRTQCTPYQYAFEYAVSQGNRAATEYFFQKLTLMEREESLVRSLRHVKITNYSDDNPYKADRDCHFRSNFINVFWFLLSQMNEEQQMQVFKKHSCMVLKCLLDWPWQSLFMEVVNCVYLWDFLTEEDNFYHQLLLKTIIEKVVNCFTDYNYSEIFKEFWQQSPSFMKKSAVFYEYDYGMGILSNLFKIEDKNNIKLFLKEATLMEKSKIIFSRTGQDICKDLIHGDKLHLLKFFIEECILSENEAVVFKEKLQMHTKLTWFEKEFTENKDKWDRFFQLLDDFIDEYKKYKK